MMPRNVAKSGTVRTLLSSVMIAVPMPMPNSATPTGRPMASTEPNATIRMTMAKARPSTSDDGSSNSAKMNPPSSMSQAVDRRACRRGSRRGSRRRGRTRCRRASRRWRRRSCRRRALGRRSARSPPSAYGLSTRYDVFDRRRPRRTGACIASCTAGSSTPCSARNTIVPVMPVPWPPKSLVEDVEAGLRLDVGQVELVAERAADGARRRRRRARGRRSTRRGRAGGGRGTRDRVVRTQQASGSCRRADGSWPDPTFCGVGAEDPSTFRWSDVTPPENSSRVCESATVAGVSDVLASLVWAEFQDWRHELDDKSRWRRPFGHGQGRA